MSSDPVITQNNFPTESNENKPNPGSSDLVVEQTLKSDSGMEEESFNHSTGLSESSDDEKDDIGVRKSHRGTRRMIFDDDDDDDEEKEDVQHVQEAEDQTGEESDTGSKQDEDDNNLSAEVSDETDKDKTTRDLDLKTNSDLYDAELSDEDRPGFDHDHEDDDMEMKNSDNDANDQSGDSNDEGFDESQLDPALAAKLKKLKGAGKKGKERTKYERKSKPTAEKMLEIYSESQKMLRGSRINLPYYEPETKSLNDFLARASKKRQEYAGLKRARDIVKAQIIQDKLAVPVLPSPPMKLLPRARVLRDEAENVKHPELVSRSEAQSSNDIEGDSGLFSVDPDGSQQKSKWFPDSVSKSQLADDDELPDFCLKEASLVPSEDAVKSNTSFVSDSQDSTVPCKQTSKMAAGESDSPLLALDEESDSQPLQLTPLIDSCSQINTAESEQKGKEKDTPALQKDPSMDLFSSANSLLSEHPKETVEDSSCKSLTSQVRCSVETVVPSDISAEPMTSQCLSPKLIESCDNQLPSSETVQRRKKSLLERLQGMELPSLPSPQLSGSPSDVICLVEPSRETPLRNPGLLKLMNKFAEHSKKRTPKAAHDVSLSIISKEGEEGTRKELKLHSLTYKVQEEEETPNNDTPGSKLLKLKQQLDVGMRLKREEARQRRMQLYALENEEGFEGKEEEEVEDEDDLEEEMTESSSSGEEEVEEAPMVFGNESDDEEDYNPLLDNEAKEDSDDDGDDDGEDGDQSVREENLNEDSNDIRLHFDASEDDEESKSDGEHEDDSDGEILTARKKTRKAIVEDSDAESADEDANKAEAPTQILESQRDTLSGSGRDHLKSLWSCDVASGQTDYQDKVKFRRENSKSPELYSCDKSQSQYSSAQHIENSNSSQYVTHVPTLDKDGFFKLTQKPSFKMASEDATNRLSSLVDSGFDALTPGNIFKGNSQQASSQILTPGNIFQDFVTQPASGGFNGDDLSQDKQSMDSFLHFGKDTIINEAFQSKVKSKQLGKPSTYRSFSDEDECDVYDPFSVLTKKGDNAKPKKLTLIKPVLTDSEDEHNGSQDSGDNFLASEDEDKVDRECDTDVEEPEENSERNFKFTGFKDRKKGIRKEFVEDEAELSGSEYESDEDLDLAEADDILEEEEGDRDMAGVSEDQLREEVGRVHMKRLQDDDDKQVMFFKEKYLQDGDLYSDGAGRMRNFRWKNSETDSQQDMFNASDEEQHEEDNDEQQWRKDRYEREKFLEEVDPEPNEDDSQLLKLGHHFLKKKESSITKENVPAAKPKMLPPEPPKPKLSKKGSFLSRKDDTRIKIAQVTKSLGTTARNTKNFIFQSVDPLESQEVNANKDVAAPSKRKAHSASQPEQPVKKLKLTDVPTGKLQKRRESIFNLLE